jgi:SulP family sulfate permease
MMPEGPDAALLPQTHLLSQRSQPPYRYYPELIRCLKNYSAADFRADVIAGIIVGIVALPLSIALAIAVGAPPQAGLYTAIIGGGAIAILGGSRTQVSGPTAAFIVILAPIYTQYRLEGLMVAGLLAGLILIAMGISGLGSLIKYVPYPVTTGFTTGIAVTIAVPMLRDLFGLDVKFARVIHDSVPATVNGADGVFVTTIVEPICGLPDHFIEKVSSLYHGFLDTPHSTMLHTGTVGIFAVLVLIFYPRLLPTLSRRIPAPLIAVLSTILLTLALAKFLKWEDIATLGTRFKEGIPRGLPAFNSALFTKFQWTYANLKVLIMPGIAIAMLGAIESLLSAVVADGMAGTKHNSNSELIGQGIGNILSPLFGGIAATGAIARTATNIRNGAKTPVASICHAITLLLIMLAFAPYASYIPMATLGAILIMVAYNMAEIKHFRHLLHAPRSDTLVLLTCFFLTVFMDMVVAVVVGMILAALLFMRRMSDITSIDPLDSVSADAEMQSHELQKQDIPRGVTIYNIDGPFFFGASEKAITAMETVSGEVQIVVLRLNRVPAMDATGLFALEKIVEHLKRKKIKLILSGVRRQPRSVMENAGFVAQVGAENITSDIEWALVRCYELLGPAATATASKSGNLTPA